MSRTHIVYGSSMKRFPRVGGDEPAPSAAELARREFSPRERG